MDRSVGICWNISARLGICESYNRQFYRFERSLLDSIESVGRTMHSLAVTNDISLLLATNHPHPYYIRANEVLRYMDTQHQSLL
jgi:hypothetical protein